MDERASLLDDAPETYYLTDYYRSHPVVLVRLSSIDREALRDLLSVAWRLTLPKAKMPGRRGPASLQQEGGAQVTRQEARRSRT